MATTKETMKVIADGIGREEAKMNGMVCTIRIPDETAARIFENLLPDVGDANEEDPIDAMELAEEVSYFLADLTADRFLTALEEKEVLTIIGMIEALDETRKKTSAKDAVEVLKHMFGCLRCEHVADLLELLNVCAFYEEYTYDFFMDAFLANEDIACFLPRFRFS